MSVNIKPVGDKVVIKQTPSEEVTVGGIVLPDTAKEKPQQGVIVAVGPGRFCDATGQLAPMPCQVGDMVLFSKYSGTEWKHDNEKYLILSADRDILAILG